MSPNDRKALAALGVIAAVALLTWAVAWGAFDRATGVASGGWIYEYQSLIGGIAALGGAAIGAAFLWHQIKLQQSNFREQMAIATADKRAQIATAVAIVVQTMDEAMLRMGPNPTIRERVDVAQRLRQISATEEYRTIRFFVGTSRLRALEALLRIAETRAFVAPLLYYGASSERDPVAEELCVAALVADFELRRLGERLLEGWR